MSLHPLAGKPAPRALLVNVPRLITAYYTERPSVDERAQRVSDEIRAQYEAGVIPPRVSDDPFED